MAIQIHGSFAFFCTKRVKALDQTAQELREGDPHRATHAAHRKACHPEACDARPVCLRAEVWCAALAALASTGVAVMGLLAGLHVALFLQLGCLAPGPDRAEDPSFLLPSVRLGSVVGQQEHGIVLRA